jgi:membrane protein YdbS with pleckstrin-like domain
LRVWVRLYAWWAKGGMGRANIAAGGAPIMTQTGRDKLYWIERIATEWFSLIPIGFMVLIIVTSTDDSPVWVIGWYCFVLGLVVGLFIASVILRRERRKRTGEPKWPQTQKETP